jgi:uncharacterized protein YjdB
MHVLLSAALLACGGGTPTGNSTGPTGGNSGGGGTTAPTVATVTVSPTSATLAVGAAQQLTAAPKSAAGVDITGKSTSWSSATPAVATVSAAGLVTAVGPGTASITATIDGVSGSSTITVTPVPVAAVSVSPATTTLSVSQTVQLQAAARDASGASLTGRPVSWSSNAPAIATISTTGLVTAVGPGSATLTATVEGITGTATVTVTQPAVASVTITPTTGTLAVGQSLQFAAAARDAGGATLSGRPITWSSSAPAIAAVSASGMVTAVASGSASIQATIGGISANAVLTVTAAAPTCTSRQPFTRDLIDPANLKVVTQIGVVGGGNTSIVGRSYAFPNDNLAGVRLPITAPASGLLRGAAHYIPDGAPVTGYTPDWSLYLDFGCGQSMELYHIKDLTPAIKAVIDTSISNVSAWKTLSQPIPFAAGDPIGWYIKGFNSVAFDVVMWDTTVVNRFENQPRYELMRSNLLNVVCPWTQFETSRRTAYMALIGSQTGVRTPGGSCGTAERDVAGTPAGQWFLSATPSASWSISMTGNYGDPLPIVLGNDSTIYIGHIGASSDFRIERNAATWKDPATITTSWCYQASSGSTGWLWLRMNSRLQMDAAYGATGSCPASFPSSGFMPYYR